MNRKRVCTAVLGVLFVCVTALLSVAIRSSTAQSAGPCKPCDTWGQVKSCYSAKPHGCCDCQKFEQQ